MEEIPLLSPDKWLESVDSHEAGQTLPNPFEGFLPSLVTGRATFLGGPTGGGKTALGLQIWRCVLDGGYRGAYLTLEMTPADLFERFARQFNSEEEARRWIKDHDAQVSESYMNPKEIEQVMKMGFDFVVLDHLHELPYLDRISFEQEISRIA